MNKKFKLENLDSKYDNLFYVLESNIKNIEIKDLNNIPGLNEFIVKKDNYDKKTKHNQNNDSKNQTKNNETSKDKEKYNCNNEKENSDML